MPTYPITDKTPFIQYTATAGQTAFTFNFWVGAAEDLNVYINGTLKTLTTHYSVTGTLDDNGGTVTLVSGATVGQVVTIVRKTIIKRTTGYATSGNVPASALNLELAKVMAMLQDAKRDRNRVFRLSEFSTYSGSLTMPDPSAGKALMWNAGGTAIINSTSDFDTIVSSATSQATASAASATAAAASQAAAATSATSAATNATAAGNSATTASSAATTATGAATTATTQAGIATTQAGLASTSATNAATSEANALTYKNNANTSATNAATSEANALTYKNNAQTSATNAATSETNAAASAAAAALSAASVNLRTINNQAAGYTIVVGDRNKLVNHTGTGATFAMTSAATLGSGFEVEVRHGGASGNLVVDPAGAETVGGSATITLTTGQAVVLVSDGTNWLITQSYGYGAGAGTVTSVATAGLATGGTFTTSGTVTVTAATVGNVLSGSSSTTAVTPSALAGIWQKGTDIASAATLTVPAAGGGYFHVTGTTTVTAISQAANLIAGRKITLTFDGALTLTHNATSLMLPGAANITTAAGDSCDFVCEDATNNYWRCIRYTKVSGLPVVGAAGSLLRMTVMTSTQTWNVGANTTKLVVECQARGGNGCSPTSSASQFGAGFGGSAGGYGKKFLSSYTSSVSVTVGTTDGSTTSFGAYISCTGGYDGGQGIATGTALTTANYANATDGGSATGADVALQGLNTGICMRGSGSTGFGGDGGTSGLGLGGRGGSADTAGAKHGQNARGYGAGGGGAVSWNATNNGGGGTGGTGCVIVWEYA